MKQEKVKALAARIVEECEQEGLTVAEAKELPQLLKFALNDRVEELHARMSINGSQVDR